MIHITAVNLYRECPVLVKTPLKQLPLRIIANYQPHPLSQPQVAV